MFRGIDVREGETASAICAACFEQGLIIETSGAHGEVVKVLAPLTIEDAQLDAGLDILAKALTATHRSAAAACERSHNDRQGPQRLEIGRASCRERGCQSV